MAAFICSVLCLWVVAIPLGIHAERQIAKSGGRVTGGGFATAAIALGFVGLAVSLIAAIFVFVGPNATT